VLNTAAYAKSFLATISYRHTTQMKDDGEFSIELGNLRIGKKLALKLGWKRKRKGETQTQNTKNKTMFPAGILAYNLTNFYYI